MGTKGKEIQRAFSQPDMSRSKRSIRLAKLSDLLDKGRITQEEFDKKKAKLMKD